ncbi:MAG: N-acetylmuramoyl-L-alanine amidase [Planctomycetota bacterium]
MNQNTLRAVMAVMLVGSFVACEVFAQGGGRWRPGFDPMPGPLDKPDVTWLPSPNFSSRNAGVAVDSIVMHTTEGGTSGTLAWLQNPVSQVSAHYVISPGGTIYEMVDITDKAWHATYYNSRSIGIEMVGFANQPSTWNDDNLAALTELLAWLYQTYPTVPLEQPTGNAYDYPNDTYNEPGLVAHAQVQPWNKSDPGPYFPWDDVLADVDAILNPPPDPGDFDADGDIDIDDVDLLLSNMGNADYDLTGNGVTNTNDVMHMLEDILGTKSGDANLDGKIDTADLAILASNFGGAAASYAEGDFNGSGTVDTGDLATLAASFGYDSAAGAAIATVAVPEPAAAGLAAVALGGVLLRRRARGC